MTPLPRPALLAGVAGPACFVGGWLLAGALRPAYDPVSTTISRLAEQGAPHAAVMTAGFVGFGLLVPVYAAATGSTPLRVAATTSGLATLAVAAARLSPQGGTAADTAHYVAAAVGYVAQASSPVLGRRAPGAPPGSAALGAVAGAALVASLVDDARTGLWQRLGLGLVDAWFAVHAVRLLRAAPLR